MRISRFFKMPLFLCAPVFVLVTLALSACGQAAGQNVVARIDLDQMPEAQIAPMASPDTKDMEWQKLAAGNGVRFGKPGLPPLISIVCDAAQGAPSQLRVIRNTPTDPGAQALFALIGNGLVSRLKVDAVRSGKVWRWEGRFPSDDPKLDVFAGMGAVEATLPGAGTVELAASSLPRETLNQCRQAGPRPQLG